MVVEFLVGWAVITAILKVYVTKKDIELKINIDIVILILALILSGFLTLMQAGAIVLYNLAF
jgi:hypothetical protein